jgi:hypothetical protein
MNVERINAQLTQPCLAGVRSGGGRSRGVRSGDVRSGDGEVGSVSIEAVILAPLMVGLFLFATFAGMMGMAHIKVTRAVHDAARAATQVQTPEQARVIALQSLELSLGSAQFRKCKISDLNVDAVGEQNDFVDAGTVRVAVFCTMDIAAFSWFTTKAPTFSAVGIEAVDEYRSRKVTPK